MIFRKNSCENKQFYSMMRVFSVATCFGPLGGRAVLLTMLLAACGTTPDQRHPAPQGRKVLRAVYRDARSLLLVTLPMPGDGTVPGACAQPLLVDQASGAARPIGVAEAAARQAQMQLAGATEGHCPPR